MALRGASLSEYRLVEAGLASAAGWVGRQSALQATLRQTQGLPLRVHVATFETPWQLDAFPLERLQWEHQQGFVREWKG